MTLLYGNCEDLLQTLPDNSVDMICCDLPFGTTNCKWDTPIDLPILWRQYKRIVKENAAIVLFAQTPFDKVLGCSNLRWLRYELIWEKSHPTGHLNANKMPMKAHENILVFYKKLPTYNPQKTQGHTRKTAVKRADGCQIYGTQTFEELKYDSTERHPRSVLRFPSDKQTNNLHPTQKPQALIEWLIKTYSNSGETILDNCMGSGTTGAACAVTNRRFIGIENDPHWYATACRRLGRL